MHNFALDLEKQSVRAVVSDRAVRLTIQQCAPPGARARFAANAPEQKHMAKMKCENGDGVWASYSLTGAPPATHCATCRTDDMIPVRNRKDYNAALCQTGHPTIASYSLTGERPATHCYNCSTVDMIPVRNRSRRQPQMCQTGHPSIATHSITGTPPATHCRLCSTDQMRSVW